MASSGAGSLGAVSRLDRHVLQSVSRSFYLSLRLLPQPMRPATSTGYLLARASDTLADTADVPVDERLDLLDGFAAELEGKGTAWRDRKLRSFAEKQTHPGEQVLLERLDDCFAALSELDRLQADAVREVLATIVSGQRLDLIRFEEASRERPVALKSEAELEDYCYRVAGCVGAFWTRIGLLTMGCDFSNSDPDDLRDLGVRYGMGLQLVNILRDLPEDLANGRCYLPAADPGDREEMARLRNEWLDHAAVWLESGRRYGTRLNQWRVRAASVLPALIGEDTVTLLKADPTFPAGGAKVKVTRKQVRRSMWRACWWRKRP
ncbi:squalene/phytoene synthase family protein [Luteolibacter flavescens]|uniref:Squalene/phytoene synthase family protein n=1 Tax=Luteolibacter flavescens TaxID=1859460 RepID=A0ABT3FJL7_9BACT|nr:squalene/phytoene synthase family protein [Luteolibacter flavescens]MCW1883476.1 squalene/phytoene synthase family protein [Luteolibacter flavescens]